MDDSCWFEKIPLAEFDDGKSALMTQLRATKSSSKIQFYREVLSPRRVDDLLKDMRGNHLVWLDAESFIFGKGLPKSVPKRSNFRTAITRIDFATRGWLFVYGKSNDIVASATERILLLKDDQLEIVRVGYRYKRRVDPSASTSFITPRFLHNFVEANPKRQIYLGQGCNLSQEESIALASYPDPFHVGLACRFADGGRAFVETLEKRTSDFGILSLKDYHFLYLQAMFPAFGGLAEVMSALFHVSLDTNSYTFQGSNCLMPLTSAVHRVEYGVFENWSGFGDLQPFTIVPGAVALKFRGWLPSRFHTLFLQGSGSLREMGLVYDVSHPPSAAQQAELLNAISTNQNLYRLELGYLSILDAFWKELLQVLGSHGSLRTVVFWVQRRPVPDQGKKLVEFMKSHIHLDIYFKRAGPWTDSVHNMEVMIQPIRLRNRAEVLARKPVHDRPAIFGAALTEWAGDDFSSTSLLLSKNVDLLCTLAGDISFAVPPRRRTRETDLPTSPEAKIQKSS